MTISPSATSHSTPAASGEERPQKAACVTDELLPDGSMVLYHTCARRLVTLNPTAALIWECCDGAHDPAAIAAEVREVFPDALNVEADILATLGTLIDHGMIADAAL